MTKVEALTAASGRSQTSRLLEPAGREENQTGGLPVNPASRRTSTQDPQKVAIRILGPTAEVKNAPRPLLRDTLECVATKFVAGGPLGHCHSYELIRHWIEGTDGAVIVPTGLVHRVVAALDQAGYRTEIEDVRRFRYASDGQTAALPLLGAVLADTLICEPRGLIEASGRKAIDIAASIAILSSKNRVLVVAKNRKQSWATYRRLWWHLGNAVGFGNDQTDGFTHRVLVVTLPKLAMATPDDFEVVVALDAWAATRWAGQEGLLRLGHGRVYGCVMPGVLHSRHERLILEAFFGPVLHHDPQVGAHVDVRVIMAIPPWSPPLLKGSALSQKRARWQDDGRNRFIADLSTSLAHADESALCRLGLIALPALKTITNPRIAVLVESPEHGRLLKYLLPTWPLVTAGTPDAALPSNAIVTLIAATEKSVFDVDVLVRADGDIGPLAPNLFPPRRAFPGSSVVLIDLADDADEATRRNTAERIAWYDRRGWVIEGRPLWTRLPGIPSRKGDHK